ncbi:hypothetical protein IMSAGC019_00134 [Lachnospiraceae bacterium]|nr:hypothetical protein IMSAGC019_00134 [Lachnospiraceae bacterium]
MAFIEQKPRMLYKLYTFFNYSVLDTMIFITSSSVLEVKKYVKAIKIND